MFIHSLSSRKPFQPELLKGDEGGMFWVGLEVFFWKPENSFSVSFPSNSFLSDGNTLYRKPLNMIFTSLSLVVLE